MTVQLTDVRRSLDRAGLVAEIDALLRDLYPLPRSLTGEPNRRTLDRMDRVAPFDRIEVPSGTPVLDWTVPEEWNVREAWIADATGRRLVDWAEHHLHLVGYSRPVRATLTRAELEGHLHSLPDRPKTIPYRTSYHADAWGFCLTDEARRALGDGPFEVCVDATLAPGSLTYGEAVIAGEHDAEVLVTTHLCHPHMANDNATGLAAAAVVNRILRTADLRRTHRVLAMPGTIGAITWLATHRATADRVVAGLVLTGLGDDRPLTYKRSRAGDRLVDRAAAAVLAHHDGRFVDFSPYGYDERQFCSPGFDLGVGRLTRGTHGDYPEYHSSDDDLTFVSAERVTDAVLVVLELLDALEHAGAHRNLAPFGEPQLGRRGLYSQTGGAIDHRSVEMAYLWVLNQSDGHHDLIDIAVRSGLHPDAVVEAARRLTDAGLLAPA